MNRATLLIALLITLNTTAQVESGTIRVVKTKTPDDTYFEFMRENPQWRGWCCQVTTCGQRNISVVLGPGYDRMGYMDMGIISATPHRRFFAGMLLSVKPQEGSSLSPFAQWTMWQGNNGYRILSGGLRGFLPLDGRAENGIQPYLAWSIPTKMLRRIQVNTGYEFSSGKKTEAGKEQHALHLGLWFFL